MAGHKKGMKRVTPQEPEAKEIGTCGECANCTPVTKFHTLSIDGEPTMGRCPKEEYCVLLSQKGCQEWKKKKKTV